MPIEDFNELNAELNDLQEALGVGPGELTSHFGKNTLVSLPNVIDEFLSEKAKIALDLIPNTTSSVNGCSEVLTLGAIVKVGNESKAAQEIAKAINDMAEDNVVNGYALTLTSMKMVRMPLKAESVMVFAGVLVPTMEHQKLFNKYHYSFLISETIPKELESLDLDLKPCEFGMEVKISMPMFAANESKNTEDILNKNIKRMIALLPQGTELVRHTACAVTGLYAPYEVIFTNPNINTLSKIEPVYHRDCSTIEEENGLRIFKEYILLTGVKYYNKEGKELFK